MRSKVFLSFLLMIIVTFAFNVQAKTIPESEIDDDSYIIGEYLFTRKANVENNYNGELTTELMLLAAKSIDGGDLDDMKVYYKNFLGQWINGITGASITPPTTFEITNRNLMDLFPSPELECVLEYDELTTRYSCDAGVLFNNNVFYGNNAISNQFYSEYYVLKRENGELPTNNVLYLDGFFTESNTSNIIVPVKLENEEDWEYGENDFVQFVSRFYYLDDDEKIYSEYSNIENSGLYTDFGLKDFSEVPRLNARLTNVGLYKGVDTELNYYNVEFNLINIDTTKYVVPKYEVYTNDPDYNIAFSNNLIARSVLNDDTYRSLYYMNLIQPKYSTPHFMHLWRDDIENGMTSQRMFLTAYKTGETSNPEVFNDVSESFTYSMRFDELQDELNIGKQSYVAKIWLCDKENQTKCYTVLTKFGDCYAKN